MEQFMEWLNSPLVKTLLLLVAGFALKKWPAFLNKWIPLALTFVSGLLTFVQFLASLLVPVAHAQGVTIPLPQPHQPWWHYLAVSVLLPVLMAVGAHSSGKNTIQALRK
jgi:hypothetical protein